MQTLRTVGMTVLVAALVAGWAAPAAAEIKLGQVDIVSVVDQYERTRDAEADAKVEEADLKTAAEPKIRKIEELRLQRDGFNKDSAEWQRLDEAAFQAEIELRNWLTFEQAKMIRKRRDTLLGIYRDIQKAVGRVAKEKGLDIVFAKAFLTPGQIEAEQVRDLADLKQHIVATAVLYPSNVIDITEEALKILNDEYRGSAKPGQSSAPKAPAPAPAPAPEGAPKG